MRYDAVILTGGRGSRLGGVDKARLLLAGRPLVERPLRAARGARRVVVVGPGTYDEHEVTVVREDPPGGGPAAGTAAGIAELAASGIAEWVLLLSCDLPDAVAGVERLLAAAREETDSDGYCLADVDGRLQWLFAIYRSESLLHASGACEQPAGVSMRRLLAPLRLVAVPDAAELSGDLDTWHDHAAWTARLQERES